MDEGLIQQIVNFVKEAAPVMWQAAYRQAYVQAINYILISIGFVACAIYCLRWYKHFSATLSEIAEQIKEAKDNYEKRDLESQKENPEIARAIFAIFVIALIGTAILVFNGAIGRIINPDYYAIQNLIELIP